MFKKVSPSELGFNPFEALGRQWMLITAGDSEKCNTMTASWGGLGVLWNKNVATCYIRPQRYTNEFVDQNEYFSLCFFSEEYRKALALCGRVSGRDCDKIAEAGLTVKNDLPAPYFAEAETVIICRKLYCQRLEADSFIDKTIITEDYPGNDFHYVYIGEISECFVAE